MEKEKENTEKCVEQAKIRYYKEKAMERLKKETRLKFIKAVYDILG